MFGFIIKMFIGLLNVFTAVIFVRSLASNSKGPIKRVSLSNRPCQARPTITDINSNEAFLSINCQCVVEVVILWMIHMLEYVLQIK